MSYHKTLLDDSIKDLLNKYKILDTSIQYETNGIIYIQIYKFAKMLSINLKNLINVTEKNKHYLIVNKKIYVNMNCMLKIINMLDMETFNKYELLLTDLINLMSFNEKEQNNKIKLETHIIEIEKENKNVILENNKLYADIEQLKTKNNKLDAAVKNLQYEHDNLNLIAKSLSKYVKTTITTKDNKLNATKQILIDKILDDSDNLDESDEDSELLKEQAINAKQLLKSEEKKSPAYKQFYTLDLKKITSPHKKIHIPHKSNYFVLYLLRSKNSYSDVDDFKWITTNVMPKMEFNINENNINLIDKNYYNFKTISEMILEGSEIPFKTDNIDYILYKEYHFTSEKIKKIDELLSLIPIATEHIMMRLIDII